MSRLRGPQKSLIYWGAFNDDAKSSVNTTSLSNASDIIHAISLPNAARPLNSSNAAHQSPITNHQSPITNYQFSL